MAAVAVSLCLLRGHLGDAGTRSFRNRSPAKKRPEVIRLNTEIEIHVIRYRDRDRVEGRDRDRDRDGARDRDRDRCE